MGWQQREARLFRWLLYAFPAEFRHEYASEMERLFADRSGNEPRWRVWLEAIADIAWSAPREHWGVLIADLRYGLRMMRAAPLFTAVAVLVMALGIGSTAAVFSVVNAVLLRSLPYREPSRLVYLWEPMPSWKGTSIPFDLGPNVPDYFDWQRSSKSFSSMAIVDRKAVNVLHDGVASRVGGAFVSPGFFKTFGVSPVLGRALDGGDGSVVIGSAFAEARFGSVPAALGRKLVVNRKPYTVAGVMPKEFGYPFNGDIPNDHSEFQRTELWLPFVCSANRCSDRVNFASIDAAVGRLRPGVSASQAEAELKAIEARLNPLYPKQWQGWTAYVKPLVETILGPVRKMLWLLFGMVGVVLLIAIGNLANLLLARVTERTHEIGIRTALGAERGRLIRQLLTESLLLSGMGGALGVGLACVLVPLLVRLNPGEIPRFDSAAVDGRVLLVALVASMIGGLLGGLAPTLAASRASVNQLLRQGGTRGVAGSSNRLRHALIIFEVALSVVLLAGAGLLIRSYLQLEQVNPGFSPSTLTFTLPLDERYGGFQQQAAFYKRFLAKLKALPGVESAGAANRTPLDNGDSVTQVQVRSLPKSQDMVENRSITPQYAKALGMPLLRGRMFEARDSQAKPPVAIVNESFAKTYFHGGNPLQQAIRYGIGGADGQWARVIGLVGDVRHTRLDEAAQPQIFAPTDSGDNFAIRSTLPARQVAREAGAALHSLDPSLSLESVRTMNQRMEESNARRRFQTVLLTGFAGLAVFLALVGLYGLMSYSVKQRTAEIGVRLAVGSTRGGVLRLILAQGMRLAAVGLVIGLAGAFALTRLVSGWLFGVGATDPVTFCLVPLFILLVAAGACLIPAWSATRVDPVIALRQE